MRWIVDNAPCWCLHPLKILCRPARLDYVMLPAALLLTVAVQGVATSEARFYMDDFMHLFAAQNDGLNSLLQPHGDHVFLSFKIFVLGTLRIFGPYPTAFLVAGLVLHLTNVGLLYRIVRYLGVEPLLAGFVSALWGIAPLNQGSLSWMAALGQVIMTAATLWVLGDLAAAAKARERPSGRTLTRWILLMLVAASSNGAGIAIAMSLFLFAWLILPEENVRRPTVLWLSSLVVITPIFYYSLLALGNGSNSPMEPFRAALPFFALLSYGFSSVFVSPFVGLSESQYGVTAIALGPRGVVLVGTIATVLFFVGFLVVFRRSGTRVRKVLLAFVFSMVCVYGIVAVGRSHPFFLSKGVWWLATRMRYHYIGTAEAAVVIALVLNQIRPRRGRFVMAGFLSLLLVVAAIQARDSARAIAAYRPRAFESLDDVMLVIDERVRACSPTQGTVFLPNRPFRGMALILAMGNSPEYKRRARLTFPDSAAVFLLMRGRQSYEGYDVRFVDPDSEFVDLLRARKSGTPITGLVVKADEAPGDWTTTAEGAVE